MISQCSCFVKKDKYLDMTTFMGIHDYICILTNLPFNNRWSWLSDIFGERRIFEKYDRVKSNSFWQCLMLIYSIQISVRSCL